MREIRTDRGERERESVKERGEREREGGERDGKEREIVLHADMFSR